MLSPSQVNYLRHTSPSELVDEYSNYCSTAFVSDGLPVVIAAHNEETDLPATLVALAGSNADVLPIVVENGSHDQTADIARKMGAHVLELPEPAKMAALQAGVSEALASKDGRTVLFTDADTLVGKRWAQHMSKRLTEPCVKYELPTIISGPVVWSHGEKRAIDAVQTLSGCTKDVLKLIQNKRQSMRGPNMGIVFTDELQDMYQMINPNLFVGEELAIADIAVRLGGRALRTLSPKATVVMRGDRISTWHDCVKVKGNSAYLATLYDYPNIIPYDGTNAILDSNFIPE